MMYCEVADDDHASRMVTDGRFKLIYYPVGNRTYFFDLQNDPNELTDLSGSAEHRQVCGRLKDRLIQELYGGDEAWARHGELCGLPAKPFRSGGNRTLSAQRGDHWPPPPITNIPQIEWNPTTPTR
jgi:hypothetical protein